MRPRLLDLFCGAGGAAMGYHRAGFDVVGVDNRPQPRYPFEFVQADAMTLPLDGYDAIHASPPCQAFSTATPETHRGKHLDLLGPMRQRLLGQPLPWVIENVPGAPMRADLKLCGCMFRLPNLKRERWFETSWHAFDLRAPCLHLAPVISVTTHSGCGGAKFPPQMRRRAMGIDWMKGDEMALAIPPAYTEYLGAMLLHHLKERAA